MEEPQSENAGREKEARTRSVKKGMWRRQWREVLLAKEKKEGCLRDGSIRGKGRGVTSP